MPSQSAADISTAMTGTGLNVSSDHLAWPSPITRLDHRPRIYGRIDPGLDVVAYDGTQFPSAAIDLLSFDEGLDVGVVVAEVRHDRPGAEVAFGPYDAISDVAEVGDVGIVHDSRIFDLDGISDPDAVTDAGVSPNETVRSDIAVFSYHHRTDDVGSGSDPRPLAYDNVSG